MNHRGFLSRIVLVLSGFAILACDIVRAANILNYVESTRVHSAVVYVGTVSEVTLLGRNQFGISAKASVSDLTVVRGQPPATGTASLRYSSYDDQTPVNDGGLQYRIRNHACVLVFADSMQDGSPSALWQGTPAEIIVRIESLANSVDNMSDEDLDFNGISSAERLVQLALYKSLLTKLRPSP